MNDTYFSNMPIISYANVNIRNISERVKIIHSRLIDPGNYYPVEIGDNVRPDILAYRLYDDSYYDWLIWLNNNIVDPQYQWRLDDFDFKQHINDVYGSIPIAQQTFAYWRTAWPNGVVRISVADFNFNIPGLWKKYYQPIFDDYGNILYYAQAYLDWRMNTNEIIQFNIAMTNNVAPFAVGNAISITSGGLVVGQCQVVECNSTVLIAEHVTGNTASPGGLQDLFANTITATYSNNVILQTNISLNEIVFWEPVSYYMMEEEANAHRKFVSAVEPNIAAQLANKIQTELNG